MATPEMRVRPSARLLVVDEHERVLLFKFQDEAPLDPTRANNDPHWATVGGELEEGETFEEAAARELAEETGIRDAEIGPWLWTREKVLHFSEGMVLSHERYFLARVNGVTVSLDGLLPYERDAFRGHRWWPLDELRDCGEAVFPEHLAELLMAVLAGDIPDEPRWIA